MAWHSQAFHGSLVISQQMVNCIYKSASYSAYSATLSAAVTSNTLGSVQTKMFILALNAKSQ